MCGEGAIWLCAFNLVGVYPRRRVVHRSRIAFTTNSSKLQKPGTAEECKRHMHQTSAINPNDRQPAQLTHQAPGTIERASQESKCITPTSTAATRHHDPHPNRVITRSSQPTQRPAKHRRVEPYYNTDTIRLSGDTKRPPPGGHIVWSGRWTAKGAWPAPGEGNVVDERTGGGARERGGPRPLPTCNSWTRRQ